MWGVFMSSMRCVGVCESVKCGVIIPLWTSLDRFCVLAKFVDVDHFSLSKVPQSEDDPETTNKHTVGTMTLTTTSLDIPLVARGKVRDIYSLPSSPSTLLFITTDRVAPHAPSLETDARFPPSMSSLQLYRPSRFPLIPTGVGVVTLMARESPRRAKF